MNKRKKGHAGKSCEHEVAYAIACSIGDRAYKHVIVCRECGMVRGMRYANVAWSAWLAAAWTEMPDGARADVLAGPSLDHETLRAACEQGEMRERLALLAREESRILALTPAAAHPSIVLNFKRYAEETRALFNAPVSERGSPCPA